MKKPLLINPIAQMQRRVQELEKTLDSPEIGLPPVANWTKRITQVILLSTAIGIGWATMARVDVVVNASGKLEPLSQSQAVQSKTGGVVTAVLVREGDPVKQGQLLIQLDKTTLHNQLQQLLIQRDRFVQEIAVLRIARQNKPIDALKISQVKISPELMNQVQTRMLLVAQLTNQAEQLDSIQQERFLLHQQQLRDRQVLSALQQSNLQTQIRETEAQIAQTQFQLNTEQELLDRLQSLVEEGALPRVTLLQRKVTVNDLKKQITQGNLQKQQLQNNQLQRQVEVGQSLTDTHQALQRQIAELDTQFDTQIQANQRQLIQVNASLNQVKLDLKQQDVRSPADGIVFALGPKLPGMVSQAGQTLLNVVPKESLTAQVQIANADIGTIHVGMPVDIRLEAYPFTEFGSVKGVVSKIGGESVPVKDASGRSPMFPVEVRLDRQFLNRRSQNYPLTPGMSVIAMIKVRQRAPITYITEEISKAFDGAKSIR